MISLYIFFFYIIIYPVKSVFNVYSLCLILAVINLTAFKKNKLKKISLTYPEIYFLICYIFFPVISNLYSINHYRTVLGIFDNFSYLLLLIALRRFFIPADQKAFFLFIAKSVLIICVYGLFKKNFFSERLTSTYLNPNLLADAIGFSLVFLIIFYKKNIGGALMSAFLIVFLFLTKSLGTVLSLTIVFFALLLFFGTKRFGISKKKIAVMILFLFGLSCLAGYSRYNRTRNDVFGNLRLNIINSSVKSLSESPLIGTGHNTYESKIIRYVFPAIKSDLKYVKKQQNPHNFFLHIANETGIINLSIFFVMICILVSETIVNPSKIKTLGISGILLILVHHSADVGYDVPIIQYFLVLFIWCVSSEMKPAFSVIIRGRLKIILFAGFVILFILMPGLNLYSEIIAETGRKYFDENNFEKAAEKFEKSLIFVSDNGEILQKLAECYEKKFYKTGNLEYKAKSIEFFKKGSEAEPDNGFFKMNIAKAYSKLAKNPLVNNLINFYAKQAVNTEPYYAAQYLEAAELAGLTGNLNLIKHYARTGLIVEPYFLRLNIIYKKMDGSQSDRFDISIKNIKQYINKRIIVNGLDKGYIDSKSEIYYYEMMYNTKIKNIEFF